ncbi:MAG: TonB family protein [Rhizobiaceae bacterium]|nr:TonB family protein [Rhizobiaceae bacterium]
MTPAVEPVFASGGTAWPLAGLPDGFETEDPHLAIPYHAICGGIGDLTEQHFPLPGDHRITHAATAPLAPPEPQSLGRKWTLSFIASCMFHAAIAGFFLYAEDEAVLIEGADFSGVAYLGAGEDQLKAGETSAIDEDTVDVTMVTMLQAKPVETVEAEAVPVTDAAEPVEMAQPVTAELARLQPDSGQQVQQKHVDADSTPAEPAETQPVRTVVQTVPEVLATDRVEPVENDNVVQKPAQVEAAEAVETAETTLIERVEAVHVEKKAPIAAVSETSKVEPTDVTQAEQSETEIVEATAIETPNLAPQPEPKPRQIAEAEPARRKSQKQEQPQPRDVSKTKAVEEPKKADDGKKIADKARAKPKKSGNGGQNQANTRRGQADGQEKGDSRQASRGGSKKAVVGNAATSNYPGKVRSKLARIARSVRAKGKGEVVVAFAVGANGAVQSARVARSSGVTTVDQAALQAVRKASPFPPIPKSAGRSSWEFSVPLAFLR